MISAEHLADAYEAVAQANHYLVGILAGDNIAIADYDAAEQILINRQNSVADNTRRHLLAYDRKRISGHG